MNVQEMRDRRAQVVRDMASINEASQKENRDFTSDEQAQWDKASAEEKSLEARIKREERLEAIAAEEARNGEGQRAGAGADEPTYGETFLRFVKFGLSELSREERKVLQTGKSEQRGTATQITTTDSLGGYLVPEEFSNEIVKTMKHYGGMYEASRVLTTAKGGLMPWPTFDGTGTVGSVQNPEGSALVVSDATFGEKSLSAYTYKSDIIKASIQLLQDAYFDLGGFINDEILERIARIINTDLTVGNGTNKATGVMQGITTGVTAAGVTRDSIIDLIHSVDRSYRTGDKVCLMMSDLTLAAIKKLSIGASDSRPLWSPGMVAGAPDTIEGVKYVINNDMPALGSGNSPVIFGNFNKYVIRDVAGLGLARSDQRYFEELAVGFLGYKRIDGKLMDAAAVKALTQS